MESLEYFDDAASFMLIGLTGEDIFKGNRVCRIDICLFNELCGL